MGEAIISRASNSASSSTESFNAILRVQTFTGATVICSNGEGKSYSGVSSGVIDFPAGYGTWTIKSTYQGNERTATVIVSSLQIYEVNLKGLTYGIQIDCSVSDPSAACSYIDDAEGFTPLSCNLGSGICDYGSWADIIKDGLGVRPCLWNNGARTVYLNPNNYTLTEGGSSADITSGNAGDVMVEFAARWYKYSMSGNILKFEVADYDRSEDGFIRTAFLSEDGSQSQKDAFYYGAYNGYVLNNALRSLSGKAPTVNTSYNDFINRASARHSNCTIETFFKRFYILGLLMLVTKSRDGQSTVGYGRISSNSSAIATGTMNTAGLFFCKSDNTSGCKAFGIENLWGNLYTWMAGLVTMDSSGTLGIKACAPFSASGSGYTSVTTGVGTGGNYPTRYSPFYNGAIILPTLWQSNSTIGWPDYFSVSSAAGRVAYVGGYWNSNLADSGPFRCRVSVSPSNAASYCGARLLAS